MENTIIVKVAKEEHRWRQKFKTKDQKHDMTYDYDSNITPADFWIGTKEWPQFIMIERKTFSDFNSSLISGRLKEQRNRMVMEMSLNKTFYIGFILEGALDIRRSTYRKLDGAIENLTFEHSCFVLYSGGLDHTKDIIEDLARKCHKYMEKALKDKNASCVLECVPSPGLKKQQVSPTTLFVHTLSLIPNVSMHIATVITETYASLGVLLQAYSDTEKTEEEKDYLLSTLLVGQNRKLGPKLSKKIRQYVNALYATKTEGMV